MHKLIFVPIIMERHIKLHSQLLLYLDHRRFLTEMKNDCEKYLEEANDKTIRKFPPFRHLLEINVMDLLNTLSDLGNFLLKEPVKFQDMCSEILFACVQSMNLNIDLTIKPAQVAVNVRIKCIPECVACTNSKYYTGLVTFKGLLIAITKPVSYAYHTVWSCPEECEGNEVILHHIPKVPPRCDVCRSALFENSSLRRCGEQVTATFKINSHLLLRKFKIVDDLITKLELGLTYTINAVIVKKFTVIFYVEEITTLPVAITCPLPSDIEELFKTSDGLPWKFIYCLASTIGVNLMPLTCFMHLKINLLLSLTSVKANIFTDSKIIHVLVAGLDTGYVGKLMTEATKLADRSLSLGTSHAELSTTLIASSGGVCAMPLPLHTYNQKQLSSILMAIESGEIITEAGKAKLRTTIWAQGMNFKKMKLYDVANVFGTVCRGDYGEYADEIVDFALQQAVESTETGKEETQALKDLGFHIDFVAGIRVELSRIAEEVLSNYFIAARKERYAGVSVGSMEALVTTCLTSARICFRSVANVDDAVFAIWLHVNGWPDHKFVPEEFLQIPANVKTLHKVISNFKDWLEQFIPRALNVL